MLVTVSSQIAMPLALAMSSMTVTFWGKVLSAVADPLTGLSQPRSVTSFVALSALVRNFRKSIAMSRCWDSGLTRKPSGAPSR